MAKFDLKMYAREGARVRATELWSELQAIWRAFPDLREQSGSRGGGNEAPSGRRTRRRRKPMTAAQKKAVSERMRKYWAARRKAKTS